MYLQEVSQNLHTTHHLLLLPEILRHPLQRPDDARQQQVGVEAAQRQLDGVLLVITESRDQQAECHAADPLQDGQSHHPDHGTPGGHLRADSQHIVSADLLTWNTNSMKMRTKLTWTTITTN